MRKVLIFSLAYYPQLVGGAEVAIKEVTDRLGNDFEFDMVTLYAGKSRFERIGNINAYRVGFHIDIPGTSVPKISYFYKCTYVAAAFFKALLLHRKRQYDLTWSVMASFNGFSALFFKLVHTKVPFLLTLQEGDTPEHIKKATTLPILYWLYKHIFKRADYIQAISNYLLQYGKDMGATCPGIVIPNGVDFNFFADKPPQSQIKALQHELGLEPSDTVLVSTSRLVPKNAYADVIDAMTYLPASVKFLIVGTGPLEKMLKEKTRLLNLEHRVRFVGFVPHRETAIYLHTSSILVRPSLSEGMGNSFIEAMAAGLPVIGTKVGGIPDFLVHGETGLFAEIRNPKSVAEKIEALMKDQSLRDSIVKKAQEMVREKYDWNLIAERMGEVFQKL